MKVRELEIAFNIATNKLDLIRNIIQENKGNLTRSFLQVNKFYDFEDKICLFKGLFNLVRYNYDLKFSFQDGEFHNLIVYIDNINEIKDVRGLIHQVIIHKEEVIKKEEELKANGMIELFIINKKIEEYLFGNILVKINKEIQFSHKDHRYYLEPTVQLSYKNSKTMNKMDLNFEKSYLASLFDNYFKKYALLTTLTLFDELKKLMTLV